MKQAVRLFTLFSIFLSCWAQADTPSNITLSTTSSHTVTGLYLQALYAGSSCSGTAVFNQPTSSTFGAMWTGGVSMSNQSLRIGANYLYEMLYIAVFEGYVNQIDGSINSVTPGNNSYNPSAPAAWCIKLGVAGGTPVIPNASVTSVLLTRGSSLSIPITCNDSTTTCIAGSATTQTF